MGFMVRKVSSFLIYSCMYIRSDLIMKKKNSGARGKKNYVELVSEDSVLCFEVKDFI